MLARPTIIKTRVPHLEGREWERDVDLGYTFQSGLLKNLAIRVRNVTARSNYRSDIDENRLIFNYTWQLM